jgi:hypothetical protein
MASSSSSNALGPPNRLLRPRPTIQSSSYLRPQPPDKLQRVAIFHPVIGVPFLHLPAYDYDAAGVSGVHYGTIMTACWALAVNRDGYLTTARNSQTPLKMEQDDILPAGNYFYFLDDLPATKNYKICIDFRHWSFPDNVPAAWDSVPSETLLVGSVTSDAVKTRDNVCAMSGERYSLTAAHVVPETEICWVCFVRS